jgi:hypothetical protein
LVLSQNRVIPLTCKDIEALFSEYYDSEAFEEDTLPKATRAAVAAHLETCAVCAAAYDRYAALLDDVWNLPGVETPPGFHQRLMEYVHANTGRQQGHKKSIFRHANTWVAMAATLAAIFLWGLFAFSPPPAADVNGYIPIVSYGAQGIAPAAETLPQGRGALAPEDLFADTPAGEYEQNWNTVLIFAVIMSIGAVCLWIIVFLASRIAGVYRKKD